MGQIEFTVCIMKDEELLGRRKEPRFKTEGEQDLNCECFHEDDQPKNGKVIDMSVHGMRFLSTGDFRVGQVVLIELKTDRSHGAFGGIIRRVDPWVNGQTVFGCELVEPLTGEVLERLAQEGVVNRRLDDRVRWTQPAKMTWELQQSEVDIEIQDCSPGGLKILSPVSIPDDAHLRLRVNTDEADSDSVLIDAKTVWQGQGEDRRLVGLAFLHSQPPESVTRIVRQGQLEDQTDEDAMIQKAIRPGLLLVAAIVLLCTTLIRSGWIPSALMLPAAWK